jgi:FkbM family methyltransferase
MQDGLSVLDKILQVAGKYVFIHRQEISEKKETHSIVNPSYNGVTYHSILNRKDFMDVIEKNNFQITHEENLEFTNWENNGNSFVLKKRRSWSLNNIDIDLNKNHFREIYDGKFIEIGANDGIRQSNTYYFEFYKNWTGIMIEAIPPVADQCKENRSIQSVVVNKAVVSPKYGKDEVDMVYSTGCYGLMSFVNDVKNERLIKRLVKDTYEHLTVKADTLENILSQNKEKFGNTFDCMFIDCEGHEVDILKDFDFTKWDIKYLLIEELEQNDDIINVLKPHYKRIDRLGIHDYLYKKINT